MGLLQRNTGGDRILLLRYSWCWCYKVLLVVPGPSPLLGHSKDQRAQPEGTEEGAE